ncbi:MAG: hypothetical protein HY390_00160 [Deltaproteobacteria bacterium]|nr:hypothetical protein [Deltaproteobacteria bacterium]
MSIHKILLSIIFFTLMIACSYTQKKGALTFPEDFGIELKDLSEIDLSDKQNFDYFLRVIKKELSLVKSRDEILPETWNKIGQLLEIYRLIIRHISQNQILVPAKTKMVLKLDSFCLDPVRPVPQLTEVFQWVYGDSGILFYEKILKYYQSKNRSQKDLIQELIWNLANGTYYENYPDKLKKLLNEIDSSAFLKVPSRARKKIIEEGISALEGMMGVDIQGAIQIVRGKYYSLSEFKAALENLNSSYELPDKQFYSEIPKTDLFSSSRSQNYQFQKFYFFNPTDETQKIDLDHYHLKSFRVDVQRIGLTASFGDVDYFKKQLEQFFKNVLGQMGVLYPTLNAEEQALIQKYPYESLRVFWHKSRAEFVELLIFHNKGSEDGEGDAFRHFVWAGFLTHDLGQSLAKRFLKAHEQNIPVNHPTRKMDEHNNKKGMETAFQLEQDNRFSARNLYNEALKAIHNNKLIILRPNGSVPDDSSYH